MKQLSDIIRTEHAGLPLVAFWHSLGSGLTQSHIQNHGDLLAGAILCGTFGSIPGVDEAQFQSAVSQLRALATPTGRRTE
jgi:alpha-beta hydrolase superfamily lysophospholipase